MRNAKKIFPLSACIFVSLFVLTPATARCGEEPERNGFTLEVSYGLGNWEVLPYNEDPIFEIYPAYFAFGFGFYLSNSFSILYRAGGMPIFKTEGVGPDDPIHHWFGSLVFQYWVNDRIFFGGGPGFGSESADPPFGFVLNGRVGYSFANWEDHSLRVSFEVFVRIFEEYLTIGEVVALEWQWY